VPVSRLIDPSELHIFMALPEDLSNNASKLLFYLAFFSKEYSKPLARSRPVGLLS